MASGVGAKLAEMIKAAFSSVTITSAGGTSPLINEVIDVTVPDIDIDLGEELPQELTKSKDGKEITDGAETVKDWELGNVGDLSDMTTKQFGNVQSFANNPFGFITKAIIGKFAKGLRIAALAVVLFTVVQFIISELMKPGRALDRRFRRIASEELLIFTARQEQEELRYGLKQVIITTRPLLRGGKGLVNGSHYQPAGTVKHSFTETRIPKVDIVLKNRSQGVHSKRSFKGPGT